MNRLCTSKASTGNSTNRPRAHGAPYACFKPFFVHLLAQGLAAKTLRRHRDHLWMLGGEVMRRRQEDSHLRRLPVEKVTFALLEEDGGPLIWPRITEQEQDAFDATCRKFYQFLTAKKNNGE